MAKAFQELQILVDNLGNVGTLPAEGEVVSRECQSEDVKQRWTSVHLVASKKSA